MIIVVDASVALKWFLDFGPEQDAALALRLAEVALEGSVDLWQPPHFYVEMAAVLTRLKPQDALLDVRDLLQLDLQLIEDEAVYALATDLAIRLNHHLFDTLYHAVALSEPGAVLVTADRGYFRKARAIGQITLLSDWQPPPAG